MEKFLLFAVFLFFVFTFIIGCLLINSKSVNFRFHSTFSISRDSEQKVSQEEDRSRDRIKIKGVNVPIQIVPDGSNPIQNTENCSFSICMSEHKKQMIDIGIPEEDINNVISNSTDNEIKKSFLSEHGVDLAKIIVEGGRSLVDLLTTLKG